MGAFANFQDAVRAALNSEPSLTAIVGTRIFDDVPHAKESISTAYPRVSIGDQNGTESGASDAEAATISIAIHAWSRAPGRLECLRMLDAIRKALHDRQLAVSEGVIVFLNYQSHETSKDPDGETYHGIARFEGFYQYG